MGKGMIQKSRFRSWHPIGVAFLALASPALGQAEAPPRIPLAIPPPQLPPLELIDVPTAGMLERDTYDLAIRTFHAGGTVARFRLGLTDQAQIGASFGGLGVLGEGSPEWYPRPELHFKIRLLDETTSRPAWIVGFDSQGIGAWFDEAGRYELKARGIHSVLSKSYSALEGFGLHAGISYNPLEGGSQDDRPDLFAGLDLAINLQWNWALEYSTALNDDDPDLIPLRHPGRGYLNTAVSVEFAEGLSIQFNVRDLFGRSELVDLSRELVITYRQSR
ncbi:MAG: hypothetical protein CME06_15485 [Gemmatimonadetes bacterium]|nr:hypothetical protein [Gemmatimonadota bacterium]